MTRVRNFTIALCALIAIVGCSNETEQDDPLQAQKAVVQAKIEIMEGQADHAESTLFEAFERDYQQRLQANERDIWVNTVLQKEMSLEYAGFLLGALKHAQHPSYASDLLYCMQELFDEDLQLEKGSTLDEGEVRFYANMLNRRLLDRKQGRAEAAQPAGVTPATDN